MISTPQIFVERQLPLQEGILWATPEERLLMDGFAPRRQREYVAWRAIVRRELGRKTQIAYDKVGAPYLPEKNLHLSVSHSQERVAVLFSSSRCAVDLESLSRNFDRISSHYLTEEELSLADDSRFLAVAWSAKECLVKYSSLEEVNLKEDFTIEKIDWEKGLVWGRIQRGALLEMNFYFYPDSVLVILTEEPTMVQI